MNTPGSESPDFGFKESELIDRFLLLVRKQLAELEGVDSRGSYRESNRDDGEKDRVGDWAYTVEELRNGLIKALQEPNGLEVKVRTVDGRDYRFITRRRMIEILAIEKGFL